MRAGDAAHGHARDAVLDGRSVSGAPIRGRPATLGVCNASTLELLAKAVAGRRQLSVEAERMRRALDEIATTGHRAFTAKMGARAKLMPMLAASSIHDAVEMTTTVGAEFSASARLASKRCSDSISVLVGENSIGSISVDSSVTVRRGQ